MAATDGSARLCLNSSGAHQSISSLRTLLLALNLHSQVTRGFEGMSHDTCTTNEVLQSD